MRCLVFVVREVVTVFDVVVMCVTTFLTREAQPELHRGIFATICVMSVEQFPRQLDAPEMRFTMSEAH